MPVSLIVHIRYINSKLFDLYQYQENDYNLLYKKGNSTIFCKTNSVFINRQKWVFEFHFEQYCDG